MPQPRAPPADLASDDALGSGDVGSDPSYGGRPMVGCLGGLFASGATPHQWVYRTRWWSSDFGDFGGDFGDFGGAMGGATRARSMAPRGACGAVLGRGGARRSGVRVAMAWRSAADAPPERGRAARTAPPELRSREWLRTRCMCRLYV